MENIISNINNIAKKMKFIKYIILLIVLKNVLLLSGNNIIHNARALSTNSEITITINGTGDQTFLNTKRIRLNNVNYEFPYRPSEVLVDGELVNNTLYFVNGLKNNLTNITIRFNTSIDNLNVMFYGLKNITNIYFENFDTSQVTSMRSMFAECTSLISLNLSDFNTESVEDIP